MASLMAAGLGTGCGLDMTTLTPRPSRPTLVSFFLVLFFSRRSVCVCGKAVAAFDEHPDPGGTGASVLEGLQGGGRPCGASFVTRVSGRLFFNQSNGSVRITCLQGPWRPTAACCRRGQRPLRLLIPIQNGLRRRRHIRSAAVAVRNRRRQQRPMRAIRLQNTLR